MGSYKDGLVGLFPIPLMRYQYPYDYSKELEWICNYECRKEHIINNQHCNRQSEDTFILDQPVLLNIRAFIEEKIHEYITQVYGSCDELVIMQSWLNKSKRGEFHREHMHPNSIISGVWYPQINEKMPSIEFIKDERRDVSLNIQTFNNYNCSAMRPATKRGDLFLFPSNLRHSVPPNNTDDERISLSFNTWCKGSIGSKEALTYLPLDRCV